MNFLFNSTVMAILVLVCGVLSLSMRLWRDLTLPADQRSAQFWRSAAPLTFAIGLIALGVVQLAASPINAQQFVLFFTIMALTWWLTASLLRVFRGGSR